MHNLRKHPRTPLKCRIRVRHESFGELIGHTRDLSDGGVYIRHPDLAALEPGAILMGQVQDLPVPAPELEMVVTRVDAEGAGLRFVEG
ncbi:PilZ domain-containing protein [Stutzerimonas balearica]|uniref:PilZ domain-containing protein n=1 Tax=Stutzerimonas balearica TaxID=74829 RepID=UPI000772FF2B|nr:PilZ domain-containing protein [Stutzerimonas balearica]MBS4152025.1 PilZ domain-containing protein [Stutzerimonas balearica]OMG62530.1 PilZ domain-containing protein [Stutzerimonas balearica]